MDSPLTPELALAYLRELSVDLLSAVVVGRDGRHLAGDRAAVTPARALLDVPEAAQGLAIRTSSGSVFCARSETVGVVVATGPLVLGGLALHDVAEVVGLIGGAGPAAPASSPEAGPPARRSSPGARAPSTGGRSPGAPPSTAPESSPDTLRALAEAVHGALARVATLSSGDR